MNHFRTHIGQIDHLSDPTPSLAFNSHMGRVPPWPAERCASPAIRVAGTREAIGTGRDTVTKFAKSDMAISPQSPHYIFCNAIYFPENETIFMLFINRKTR